MIGLHKVILTSTSHMAEEVRGIVNSFWLAVCCSVLCGWASLHLHPQLGMKL